MSLDVVETRVGAHPLVLVRPDWSEPVRSGIDLLTAAARARAIGGAVCLLGRRDQPLRISLDSPPALSAGGAQAAWLSAVWTVASAASAVGSWWRGTLSSMSREWRRELRRQAGDERLPFELRQQLRDLADASTRTGADERTRFPRRLLRGAPAVMQSSDLVPQTRAMLAEYGITEGAPLVTFESRTRPDIASAAVEFLRRNGYTIAWIGDRGNAPPVRDGVVDVTRTVERSPVSQIFFLAASAFVMCESVDLQQLAYFTDTPSLLINAKEPFMAYPVRANGLFVLGAAIDLDCARTIAIGEMLTEPYFRDLRKREARGRRRGSFGYRDNTAEELIAAIGEMREGIAANWTNESPGQSRFRARVLEAGAALATVSPHVAEWGPDDGFLGEGRLVRFQAETVS